MIRVYHHIWPFQFGLSIADEQKERIYQSITDDFTYHPSFVKENENENHTLQKLVIDIENYNDTDFVLYIHTKGATYNTPIQKTWRDMMELSLIDEYKKHINILQSGYDTSGILLLWDINCGYYYCGNFWWVNVNFLKRIPKNLYNYLNFNNRYYSEFKFLNIVSDWNPGMVNIVNKLL